MVLNLRNLLFWSLCAAVLGVFCHIAYLLFLPARTFSAAIDSAVGAQHREQFILLSPEAQMKLLPFASDEHIVGICKFNLASGPVKISASLPEGFWSFSVYTMRGREVYAINDTQADTNGFTVEISRDRGLIANLFGGSSEKADVIDDDLGWRISIADSQGLAVIWMAVGDPLLRAESEAVVNQTKCSKLDS